MQQKYNLTTIMFSAIVIISTLYITQPIQPLLINEFQISTTQVTLFTSVILFALAIAPIFYGYLLEKFDTKLILIASLMLLGVFQCLGRTVNVFGNGPRQCADGRPGYGF